MNYYKIRETTLQDLLEDHYRLEAIATEHICYLTAIIDATNHYVKRRGYNSIHNIVEKRKKEFEVIDE